MPRQAYFNKAPCVGTTHAMAAAALTRGERSKREEDQGSPTLCPDARQPQEMHVDPCWEQRTRLIGFCSSKCRGPGGGLETKAKFVLSPLIDSFQILAVVYPLAPVSVRIVKALMRWNLA